MAASKPTSWLSGPSHIVSHLTLKEEAGRYQLLDRQGNVVGRTAKSFQPQIGFDQCEVAAVMVRFTEDSEEQYRDLNKCERWEVVVPRGRG